MLKLGRAMQFAKDAGRNVAANVQILKSIWLMALIVQLTIRLSRVGTR